MKTKHYFIFSLICLLAVSSQAQDIIVNTNNTLFGRILDVNEETIDARIQKEDIQTSNTMSQECIDVYQIDEDESGQNPTDSGTKEKKSAFRIAWGGGYAGGIGKIEKSDDAKINQMNRDLIKGYNIEVDMENYFNYNEKVALNFGAALHFNYINHHTVGTDVVIPNYGYANRYEESQIVFYLAPAFVMRYDLENWFFISSLGFGPLFFTDPIVINSRRTTGNSITMGSHIGIEANYKLSPNWGIGVKLSIAGGVINSLNYGGTAVKLKEPMSANSWVISGILSFRTK